MPSIQFSHLKTLAAYQRFFSIFSYFCFSSPFGGLLADYTFCLNVPQNRSSIVVFNWLLLSLFAATVTQCVCSYVNKYAQAIRNAKQSRTNTENTNEGQQLSKNHSLLQSHSHFLHRSIIIICTFFRNIQMNQMNLNRADRKRQVQKKVIVHLGNISFIYISNKMNSLCADGGLVFFPDIIDSPESQMKITVNRLMQMILWFSL